MIADEDLSPTAQAWMAKLKNIENSESQAFIYLNGIMAPEDDEIMSMGLARFSAYLSTKKTAEASGYNTFDDFGDYPTEVQIPKPMHNSGLYCSLWGYGCLKKITSSEDKWDNELTEGETVLRRYNKFLSFSDFKTLAQSIILEELPKYEYLYYGNRLVSLKALSTAAKNGPSDAINQLLDDIKKSRKQLVIADNLIHKMLFTVIISNDLDIIAHISTKYKYNPNTVIPQLTDDELNMESTLIREFGAGFQTFKDLDQNPEFFEVGDSAPAWLVRALFKPNMTINASVGKYEKLISLSTLSAEKFAAYKIPAKQHIEEDVNLRNFAGHVLNQTQCADYHTYIARLHDLKSKIALTNYVIGGMQRLPVNPYYPSTQTIAKKGKRICLNGPYEDERGLRCIHIE